MSQIVFDLQSHLRDMEERIMGAITANAAIASADHKELLDNQEDLGVLIRDHERRLLTTESDIRQAKWVGRTAVLTAGGLLLDFVKSKFSGG